MGLSFEQIDYVISEIEGAALEGEHDTAAELISKLEADLKGQDLPAGINLQLAEAYELAEQASLPAEERDEAYNWL